ncbi:RidA family protein [Herbaspirillum rubrisubalbicans]|uniref:RidA family protein n=1 Tax=Herbaspirillum rubrisubalbicans Os34 TaxID=1235827 RepID=A0A6M3ZMR6_9BURK|nr:RidA family protein [Herbaspirillum rubrisubalbicans]QJP99933.1 RidA family protein [Herbaspirillum rubrisubalbicans Os34]
MSPIQRFNTNARMSQLVTANGFAFVAGQVPNNAGAPIPQQASEVLAKIDAQLQAQDIDRERIVSANVWLSSPEHFAAFNAVWDAWVPAGHAPTRACVQALLMAPGLDVEVAVIAAL